MSRDFSNFEIVLAEKAQGLEGLPLLGTAFVAVREKTNGCPDSNQFVWAKWKKADVLNEQGHINRDWIEGSKDPEAGLLMSNRKNAIVLSAAGFAIEEAMDDWQNSPAVAYNYRGKSHAAILLGGFQPIGKERDDLHGAGFRMGRNTTGFTLATISVDTGFVTALPTVALAEQYVPTSEFNSGGRYPGVPLV